MMRLSGWPSTLDRGRSATNKGQVVANSHISVGSTVAISSPLPREANHAKVNSKSAHGGEG